MKKLSIFFFFIFLIGSNYNKEIVRLETILNSKVVQYSLSHTVLCIFYLPRNAILNIPHKKHYSFANLKVYTVDSKLVLSQYIPFSDTRIVLYEDAVNPSQMYHGLEEKLRKLKVEVPVLCTLFYLSYLFLCVCVCAHV